MKKIAVILLFFYYGIAISQVAKKPKPDRLYNNLSKEQPYFLTEQESSQLETKLQNFSNETSNQICIVITDDLNDLTDEQYATAIGREWGVGKKETNNGIVILIKPTGGNGKRKLFIAVGYGLEGAIPDLTTKKIREDLMYPYLKNKENYKALDGAVTDLMRLAKGEINAKNYSPKVKNKSNFALVFIIIAVILLLISMFKKGNTTYSGAGNAGSFFLGGFLGGFGSGSSFGGNDNNSNSGSDFGGFGGGDFGGGGSGGDW